MYEISAFLSEAEYIAQQQGVTIRVEKLTIGQAATTINRNADSRNKRVS